jgi:N-acyl-D-amino-acid deacylase
VPLYDVVIKGGTVVDGTRVPRFRADVAIKDGKIARVGGRISESDAAEVLDATGLIVGPGFVDLHTHYDAQIQWDPYCTISGWHGVTSVALGNCGFGYAPVRPEERDRSMMMMERNEAIPLESQREGMIWDWVTFPEWLDTLERIPKGVNCLSYMPLNPLLVWVMGLEDSKSRSATDAERAEMQRLLGEAMDAGACGFSLQRLGENSVQADYDGTPMPTDTMADEDVLALADVLRERDEGLIQITQSTQKAKDGVQFSEDDGTNSDYRFVEELAARAQRPILYNVILALDDAPEFHRGRMKWLDECNDRGLQIFGQGQSFRQRMFFTFEHWNLYDTSPVWNKACQGSTEDRLRNLSDPDIRAQLIATEGELITQGITGPIAGINVETDGDIPSLHKYVGRKIGEIAAEEEKHPIDAMLDIAVAGGLKVLFSGAWASSMDEKKVSELMHHPYVIPGVSDGGAHTKFFTGGAYTTDFLTWLVRDTGAVTLEEAHYRLSTLAAHAGGFRDRGILLEGYAADIVVYDLANLRRVPEEGAEIVYDLPNGEWRRVQRAEGYRWILVNGEVTQVDGSPTSSYPGQLLRHGRAA